MADFKEQVILVIGSMGSDAGYSVLTPHGVVHVPGNNPLAREAYEALVKSYVALQEVAARVGQGEKAGTSIERGE